MVALFVRRSVLGREYRVLGDLRRCSTQRASAQTLAAARDIFRESASRTLAERWATVRNVTTTPEMMDTLATMAGWTVRGWYAGDARVIETPGESDRLSLGQSTCVLERPTDAR